MPMDPRTMKALKAKGLHLEYNQDGTASREIAETDNAIQFLAFIDPTGRTNHANYHRMLEVAKDTKQRPRVELISCKRIVDNKSGKEYAVFYLDIQVTHYDGATQLGAGWKDYGIWYEPTFKRIYNGKKSRWEESDEVSGAITHYDYPWVAGGFKIKDLDGKSVPLESLITPETRFFLIHKGVKHTVRKEDWLTMPRDQLVDKATGTSPQAEALQALTDAITKAQALAGGGR